MSSEYGKNDDEVASTTPSAVNRFLCAMIERIPESFRRTSILSTSHLKNSTTTATTNNEINIDMNFRKVEAALKSLLLRLHVVYSLNDNCVWTCKFYNQFTEIITTFCIRHSSHTKLVFTLVEGEANSFNYVFDRVRLLFLD